ncbi:MAG: response regulator transcription factor [Eubacteriales bacterium]|nr:response regulator transcription factor [Clostridiales bacterium]MDD7308845.1 response regulator transcription factor [Eubacteriales bacterium]MDY2932656.1 response regulator transcription factor [Anaerovoracaceae bacterium]
MSKLIYAADDELNIRQLIQSFLEEEGYEVETFETGDALLEKFKQKPSDLVILDVMMPGTDGLSICNTIRKFSSVPILILTARDTTADYVTGITLGCDDYFTKPFSPVMLTMRVKAMFRRVELDKAIPYDEKLEYGDIEIMPKQKVAKCKGVDLKLTITELNVLQYLMEKNGNAVSRDELLEKIWGYTSEVETRVTDDNIKRIRKKMNQQGSNVEIVTVWGYGFKLAIKE